MADLSTPRQSWKHLQVTKAQVLGIDCMQWGAKAGASSGAAVESERMDRGDCRLQPQCVSCQPDMGLEFGEE